MMETGEYYLANHRKIEGLTDSDWMAALTKGKRHIQAKLRQKTLSGAHSPSNLGADPVDYYLGIACEKIISGAWEWKDGRTLPQQMIRIVDSYISKEVEKAKSTKGEFQVVYNDIEPEFYVSASPPENDQEEQQIEQRLKTIEAAAAGDVQLEFLVEALKEGKKRSEIADLLEIEVRQFDKLKEKLIRRVESQKKQSSIK